MVLYSNKRSGEGTTATEIEEFREGVDKFNLVDLRLLGGRWTWSNSREQPSWSRIDQFFISNKLLMQLARLSQKVLNRPISDHFPICLIPEGITWGPGIFRLDNKWLRVDSFKELAANVWQQSRVKGTVSFQLAYKLKALKNKIEEWRIEEGKIERTISDNLKEIELLDLKEMEGNIGENGRERRENIKKVLTLNMHLEAISWKQKVREKWLCEGDRNTRYFHSMTNYRRKNNYVEELRVNGEAVRDNETMRERARMFFQHLYNEEHGSRPKLDELHFKQLSEESRVGLEIPLIEEEVRGCLDVHNGDKTPSPDGFNMKFFQIFWDVI